MKRAFTAALAAPKINPTRSHLVARFLVLLAAIFGLSATLSAAPVTVPDHSFEDIVFPGATNAVAAGGTESVFNGGLTPAYDWWGAGFADTTNYPTVYVQDADSTNALFPLTADGLLEAPADGTNYVVVGGSGDMNVWQPLGPLQSNTVYTLTVAVGIDLLNGFLPSDGSSGYGGGTGVIALVGGTGIYDIFTPGDILASLPVENTNYALGSWVDNTLTFTNGYQASGDLTVLLRGLTGFALDFDNIRLDASPATPGAVLPTITTATGSNGTTNYQGTLVTLSENPVGNAPFTYVWQTDGGTHGATWTAIPSQTGPSLVADTSTIVAGASAGYRVVVNGSSTSPSVTLTSISGPPVLVRDTLPSSGSFDVVGSQVTFSAIFDGSRPITYQWLWNGSPVSGATNDMLTVSLTDTNLSGNYSLFASNALGTNYSAGETFTVNPLPTATNGIVVATGMQWGSFFGALGYNEAFTPTFAIATNSIIAGLQPSSSIGIFTEDGGGGLPILTDGAIGALSPADNGSSGLASAGDGTTTNGIGYSITYTLPKTVSGTGWTITNITSYGGWADDGREEQTYQISYSTPLAPTNFSLLPWTAFNPPNPPAADNGGGVATATRMSITSTNGVLANNVGAITINFYSLAAGQTPKNGWEGYAEFQLFGGQSTNFPPAPVQGITPSYGSDVEGSSVTIEAKFASVDPINYQWYKDGGIMLGQTNSTLVLTNLAQTDTSVTPGYVLQASNALGVSSTSPCAFTVNPAPSPDGVGVIIAEASQAIPGGLFTPTWTFASNSLLAGLDPFATTGNFYDQASANGQPEGGPPTLTDGQYGVVGNGNTLTGASAGPSAGTALYYNLPASSNGWDITGITTYGGWSDVGRNNQGYDVYFATIATPAYTFFDELTTYSPPITVAEPNATRVIWTPGNGVPFAQNVVGIEFVFTETVFNAWEGYNEIQVFGTNSTAASVPAQNPPLVGTDVAPGYGEDVVGSAVTFTATIFDADSYQWQFTPVNGTAANLAGATNTTYTINDLNTNETGGYTLIASNAYGLTATSTAQFTVNPVPDAVSNIVISEAVQIDENGTLGITPFEFLPTWTIAGGSLIAGTQPSSTGPGNFVLQPPGGGVPALTDGTIGELSSSAAVPNYATCGDVASGAGQYVIYNLPASTSGYNISSIVTYGGWPDYGRDDQYYTVMYSTVENPTHFVTLGQSTNHVPALNPTAAPNTSRITWTGAGGGTLASNVAEIEFNFTIPAGQKNDWEGYSELQVFGTPSQGGGGGGGSKGPTISSSGVSGGNLTVGGSGGTPGAGYAWLSSTNLAAPLSQWTTNSTGTFDSSGNFSGSLPISHSQPGVYFVLKPE